VAALPLCSCDSFTNAFNGCQRLPHDERRIEMQDAIAQASEHAVTALVNDNAPMMPKAVDFHDEPSRGSKEVNDVVIQRNLTPKDDAEALAGEMKPQCGGAPRGAQVFPQPLRGVSRIPPYLPEKHA
jgi:hypothetical protein